MPTWPDFIGWSFLGTISAGILFIAKFLGNINKTVGDLDKKLAVMIEHYDNKIGDHGKRIEALEGNSKRRTRSGDPRQLL